MIEETIKKEGLKNIERFKEEWIKRSGRDLTVEELEIYKLGLSTGVLLGGLGLVNSTICFNE